MAYTVGQRIVGSIIDDAGNDVEVEGVFMFRTDDPEEHIQDIVIKTDDGQTVYIDEQDARPVSKIKLNWKFSGCDWHQFFKTRVYHFLGNRVAVTYDLIVEECDGDFAYWTVKKGDEIVAEGEVRDEEKAFSACIAKMEEIFSGN